MREGEGAQRYRGERGPGSPTQGKTGKMTKTSLFGNLINTWDLEILPKHRESTGNSVCPSCETPDTKDQGYCDICCETFQYFLRKCEFLPCQFCL